MEIVDINIPGHKYNAYIGRNLPKNITSFLSKYSKNQNILIVTDDYFEDAYARLIFDSLIGIKQKPLL